jgi:hypothetical protein
MHLAYKQRRRLALYFTLGLDRTSKARDVITQAFYPPLGNRHPPRELKSISCHFALAHQRLAAVSSFVVYTDHV